MVYIVIGLSGIRTCGYNLRQNCMLYRGYTPKMTQKVDFVKSCVRAVGHLVWPVALVFRNISCILAW